MSRFDFPWFISLPEILRKDVYHINTCSPNIVFSERVTPECGIRSARHSGILALLHPASSIRFPASVIRIQERTDEYAGFRQGNFLNFQKISPYFRGAIFQGGLIRFDNSI